MSLLPFRVRPASALRRLGVAAAGCLVVASCANPDDKANPPPVPVEGTAYRVSAPKVADGSELTVDILYDRRRCQQVFTNPDRFDERFFEDHEERIQSCLPKVDRASGQVQVSFRLAQQNNKNRLLMLPLEKEHIAVRHLERDVPTFEFEQYQPKRAGQLFILLVDHSASMRIKDEEGVSRMQRVQNALWANRDTFISSRGSEDVAAVALYRFTRRVEGISGESYADVKPIQSEKAFQEQLSGLGRTTGFTHLYDAVATAVGPIIDRDTAVTSFLALKDLQPTVVLLTDGFNNERGDDLCATNAPRLADALQAVKTSRRKPPSKRPTVYTVGFGVGFRPGWKAPEDDLQVSPRDLCGDLADRRIDGDLDKTRIDNVSLQWMARAGGGRAFIKSDHRELEKVFAETAPMRYVWYKVKYAVDPFYHRSSFPSRIVITRFAAASAAVEFHPSAWLDAPTGLVPPGEERWVAPGDIRRATALTVPLLGGLVFLTFLGPALFNGRRALFRRARKSSKKKK